MGHGALKMHFILTSRWCCTLVAALKYLNSACVAYVTLCRSLIFKGKHITPGRAANWPENLSYWRYLGNGLYHWWARSHFHSSLFFFPAHTSMIARLSNLMIAHDEDVISLRLKLIKISIASFSPNSKMIFEVLRRLDNGPKPSLQLSAKQCKNYLPVSHTNSARAFTPYLMVFNMPIWNSCNTTTGALCVVVHPLLLNMRPASSTTIDNFLSFSGSIALFWSVSWP